MDTPSQRLDQRLSSLQVGLSRAQAQRFIKEGSVTVNGVVAQKPALAVSERDVIVLNAPVPAAAPTRAQADASVSFTVLYESPDVIVIDKPTGLSVHPGEKRPGGTLVDGLLAHYPELETIGEDPLRPGIVHRLDKDTSGVMIVARTPAAFVHLKNQFSGHKAKKTYQAIVRGVIAADETVIDRPVGRSQSDFRKMAAGAGTRHPRSAVTHVHAEERFQPANPSETGYTLVTLQPTTGRMHQLRVHLAAIGFPMLGETTYAEPATASFPIPRILLHARSLTLTLPSGVEQTFEAPLPDDFATVLTTLRSH